MFCKLLLFSYFLCSSAFGATAEVAEEVKITILSDMVTSYLGAKPTRAEWGFAALVEVKEDGQWKKLLFDSGNSAKIVLHNARIMGVDLCSIEHLVLSHNHDDHTSGLVELRRVCRRQNPNAFRFAHVGSREIFWRRPIKDKSGKVTGEGNRMVRMAPQFRSLGGQFLFEPHGRSSSVEGFSSVVLTGSIPRLFDEKTYSPSQSMLEPGGQEVPDTLPEDQALVIKTAKGAVVLVGCAHAGIHNTLAHVSTLLKGTPIYAVIGGMHLIGKNVGSSADPGSLTWLGQKLRPFNIQHILGAHCTGIEKVQFLRSILGLSDKTAVVSTIESRFELSAGIVPTDLNDSN